MATLKDKCAIVGVGETKYIRGSGVSTLHLAAECSRNAIADAGLTPKDIDGMILFHLGDPVYTDEVAANLGIPELGWQLVVDGGGNNGCAVVATAGAAINAGLAHNVLVLHACNRYSGVRFGAGGGNNLMSPFGKVQAPQMFALWAQRHMAQYGTKAEHFGAIAVACRYHAGFNEGALMRQPITMDDYMKSRMITTPLRLLDCCLETDGGAALVVTSAERAKTMKQEPIYIMGAAGNSWGPAGEDADTAEEYCSLGSRYAAKRVFGMAEVTPKDIDVAGIYDCFTYTVLTQFEDYGFCAKGEGGPWVGDGKRITLGGEMPINTSGGHLSEGYVRSMNLMNEVVRQLRGQSGKRQVKGAEIGLVTGAPNPGSALILRR